MTTQPDRTQTAAPFEIAHEPTEITHLDTVPRLVGYHVLRHGTEGLRIDLAADVICSMCVDGSIRLSGGALGNGACPLDHLPCPDDPEIDEPIDRATS